MSFEGLLEVAEASVSDSALNDSYDGVRSLDQVGISVPTRIRALEIVVNWPRLVVDTTAEVLTVEGFESGESSREVIDRVWRTWNQNNMGSLSYLAHVEAMVQGEAFAIVGVNEFEKIRTTIHPRDGIAVEKSADGEVMSAVVVYEVPTEHGSVVKKAAYYTPDKTEVFQQASGMWGRVSSTPGVGVVPIVPIQNSTRIGDTNGRSEMDLVMGFANAGSRSFTLLQLATEIMSFPQRWISNADMSKMKRPDGSTPSMEEIYLGSYMFAPADAKFGQFPGADLGQIIDVIKTCAEQVSAFSGIPPSMLGVTTSNPASAEAMRAAKERLIARCERKQQTFGDSWEHWARVVLSLQGHDVSEMDALKTVWRDVALPSVSAKSAALLQAHAQGAVSAETARDGLPLTPEQRARENARGLDMSAVVAREDLKAVN